MTNFTGSLPLAETQAGLFLTTQEKAFCKGVAQGLPPATVAKSIGLTPVKLWIEWMERQDIVETLAILKNQVDQFMGVEVTRDLLNSMLFEAHATADCSNAKIASIREIGKMNGLYEPDKLQIDKTTVTKIEHLEALSDEELLRRANINVALKNSEDAVFEEIE